MPSHPELLDWLADEFVSSGWDLKQLHRLIMTSTVYMQQSLRHSEGNGQDSTNQLYWHFPVHRVNAESLRDSVLLVSGRLDKTQFGPAIAATTDDTGQVIVKSEKQRRSIYLQAKRTQPVAMLTSFDAPVMKTNCAKRESSTVATQSLMLMNSDFILQSARAFAERVNREAGDSNVVVPDKLNGALDDVLATISNPWQYGYGFIDSEDTGNDAVPQVTFQPYPFFGGATWKGGEQVPDSVLGFSFLNAGGGHPQARETQTIRRWVSPVTGKLKVTGSLSRPSTNGDGVHLTLYSSRQGMLAEVSVPTGSRIIFSRVRCCEGRLHRHHRGPARKQHIRLIRKRIHDRTHGERNPCSIVEFTERVSRTVMRSSHRR